jgi:hypothetical protein
MEVAMESLGLLIGIGVLSGALLAWAVIKLHLRLGGPSGADAFVRKPLSTDVINMASIKVAGLGGLGLVVVATIVAFTIPAVGTAVGTGLIAGSAMALFLIVRRRRLGVLPSSTGSPGAHTMLALEDHPSATAPNDRPELRRDRLRAHVSPV